MYPEWRLISPGEGMYPFVVLHSTSLVWVLKSDVLMMHWAPSVGSCYGNCSD